MQDWFAAWQTFAWESRDCKKRTQLLKEALKAHKVKKAVIKWKARMELTLKMRNFVKQAGFIKRKITLRAIVQAWRRENRAERAITTRAVAFAESLRSLNLKQAFDFIKRFTQEKQSLHALRKVRSREVLTRACAGFYQTKARAAFNKWR